MEVASRDLTVQTFEYNPEQFSLDHTLASGQCFRWKRQPDGWWIGVVGRNVLGIKQESERFLWWGYPGPSGEEIMRDYFMLDTDLGEIVRTIAEADPAAGEAARRWQGLRLVRQDPEEVILAFVC